MPPSQSLNYHLGIGRNTYEQGSPVGTYVGKNGGGEASESTSTMNNDTYYPVKIVKEGTTIKFYFNNSLIRTDTTYGLLSKLFLYKYITKLNKCTLTLNKVLTSINWKQHEGNDYIFMNLFHHPPC